MEVVSFTFEDEERKKIAHEIRRKVFIEEQNVDPKHELDSVDSDCLHFLLYVRF
jgi:predicted GNAT family N-acyltransferase